MSHPAAQRVITDLIARLRRVVEQTAEEAEAELKESISIPAAVGGDGFGFVISSAPGEPPRLRTGRLLASVFRRVGEDTGVRLYFQLGATAPYAGYLERGTSRMAARPFQEPIRVKYSALLIERLRAAAGR